MPALYLSLDLATAIKEANQGFARKIELYVLCSYEVDCENVADLVSETDRAVEGVTSNVLGEPWFAHIAAGTEPPQWKLVRRLLAKGAAGALVPSYAPGATSDDRNLVLWRWGPELPHKVAVYDPSGRLPKNRLSWD